MSVINHIIVLSGGGRNCGIELLRILSMLMILTIHYWLFCFPLDKLTPLSFEWIFGTTLKGFSQCGVNVFVLISAYYLCTSGYKIKRIWSIITQVLFYSISVYLFLLLSHLISFSVSDFRVLFPVLFREYWFVTEYVGMIILSPFMNRLISSMSSTEYKHLIFVIISLFVIYQSVFFFCGGLALGRGMDIVWFVCLYFIGAYLRLYCNIDVWLNFFKKNWILSLIIVFLPSIWGVLTGGITFILMGKTLFVEDLWVYNSLLVLPASVVWFILAFKLDIKESLSNPILIFGKTSFAVYLITDNRNMRYILWDFIGKHTSINTFNIVWQFFATIIVLYLICSVVDLFRQFLFSKVKVPVFISNKFQIIDNWFNLC